jgi:hypothetical protein
MAIYSPPLIDTLNASAGLDNALVSIAGSVPAFTPMLLIFVWLTIMIGGYIKEKRRLGGADMPMWCTIASVGTMLVALPLTLTVGLIDLTTLSIVIVVTVMSGVWLFFSRNRNEV